MANKVMFKTKLLDLEMKEAFDWSNSTMKVRDALWNYFMEVNDHNTMKTEKAMLPFMKDSEEKIKLFIENHLQ